MLSRAIPAPSRTAVAAVKYSGTSLPVQVMVLFWIVRQLPSPIGPVTCSALVADDIVLPLTSIRQGKPSVHVEVGDSTATPLVTHDTIQTLLLLAREPPRVGAATVEDMMPIVESFAVAIERAAEVAMVEALMRTVELWARPRVMATVGTVQRDIRT